MAETKKTGGLAGVTAGKTALCTVGKEGAGLTYCGYDIYDLADNASFEEVAFLLLHGKLPTRPELDAYIAKIKSLRGLPDALKVVLEMVPGDAHPMDVLRTGVSFLGNIEPEASDFSDQQDVADRLLACLPSMMVYWHRFHTDGVRIDTETDDDTIAGHILHMLHDAPPSELHEKSLSTTLILYAEHEFNASTFAGRVITGTLSDMHSAITGAIGALRGPLHGGANEAAMELIQKFGSPAEATAGVRGMLERRELIMGFGHRVYTTSDPRNSVNKAMSKKLAESLDRLVLEVARSIREDFLHQNAFHEEDTFTSVQKQFMTDDQGTAIWGKPKAAWQRYRAFYREKVKLYDGHAGKVLAALKQAGGRAFVQVHHLCRHNNEDKYNHCRNDGQVQLVDGFAVQAGEKLRAADIARGIDEQGKHHVFDHRIDRNTDLADDNGNQQRAGHAPQAEIADFKIANPIAGRHRQKQRRHGYLLEKRMQKFHYVPPPLHGFGIVSLVT